MGIVLSIFGQGFIIYVIINLISQFIKILQSIKIDVLTGIFSFINVIISQSKSIMGYQIKDLDTTPYLNLIYSMADIL